MARPSTALRIDPDGLKALFHDRGLTLENVGEAIGVSKQALSDWLKNSAMPARRLYELTDALRLDESERRRFYVPAFSEPQVLFRTWANAKATPEQREKAALAGKIETVHAATVAPAREVQLPTIRRDASVSEAAHILDKFLGFPASQLHDLQVAIPRLAELGIRVVFADLGEKNAGRKESKEAQAAYITDDKCHVIVINWFEKREDVAWRIIHELTHALRRDREGGDSEQETFANAVANNLMTPVEELRTAWEGASRAPFWSQWNRVQRIAGKFGCSESGVVVCLEDLNLLSGEQLKYFWSIIRRSFRPTIKDISFPNPESDDLAQAWVDHLEKGEWASLLALQWHSLELVSEGRIAAGIAALMFSLSEAKFNELLFLLSDKESD